MFPPETSATLSLQDCVAQPGAAAELLAGPGAAGSARADAIPRASGLAAAIPAALVVQQTLAALRKH